MKLTKEQVKEVRRLYGEEPLAAIVCDMADAMLEAQQKPLCVCWHSWEAHCGHTYPVGGVEPHFW